MFFFILWLCLQAGEKLLKPEVPADLGNHPGMQPLSAMQSSDPRLEEGGQGSEEKT